MQIKEVKIKSETDPEKTYTLKKVGDKWYCNCPAFFHGTTRPCKHIINYLGKKPKKHTLRKVK
jgi:hypothetical protein